MSSTIKNTSDLETKIIPEVLNICDWLKANKLTLNALKTEFMIMGSHQRVGTIGCARTIPAIVADGKVVRRVAHTKSLGIVADNICLGINILIIYRKISNAFCFLLFAFCCNEKSM